MSFTLRKYVRFYKEILPLALPVVISNAGQILIGIIDNAMIGKYSTLSLSASGLAINVFNLFFVIGLGYTLGFTPQIGNFFGKKKYRDIGRFFGLGLVQSIFLVLFLIIGMHVLSAYLDFINPSEAVVAEVLPYYYTLEYSLFPLLLFFAFKQFAEGLGSTKPAMVFSILSNLINVILNYLLIYGNFGFEEMGLYGAGIATLISRVFLAVGFILYVFTSSTFRPFLYKTFSFQFSWEEIKGFTKTNLSIAFQLINEIFAFAIGALLIGKIGKNELAAHQIAIGLAAFTFMISSGIASATTILTSKYYGENRMKDVTNVTVSAVHIVTSFMFVAGILFLIANTFLPGLHTDDPKVIEIASSLMFLAAIFQIFDGIQVVIINALRGINDTTVPSIFTFIAFWIISLPVGYYASFVLGYDEIGIWIGFVSGLTSASIFYSFRFYYKMLSLK